MLSPKWEDFLIRALACAFVAFLLILATMALGQEAEHEHGVGDIPNWYDNSCCNKTDCRPVPYEDVEEQADGSWLYKPLKLIYRDEPGIRRIRDSKDGRFHVCHTSNEVGRPYALCIYIIRTGV